MRTADYWIEKLTLQPHPEGGFFRETYRSPDTLSQQCLPVRYSSARQACTCIYYLLKSDEFSQLHRIKSDEIWHFYAGSPLTLFSISPTGDLLTVTLGSEGEGHSFQAIIPHNHWFGAYIEDENSFALIGCTVAPGFDFDDFEVASRSELITQFPNHQGIIKKLTKP